MLCTITEIKPLKSGLFAIYIDNEYFTSIDDETLVKNRLKQGAEIDSADLDEIINISKKKRTAQKAMNLLSFRDHSKAELKKKLRRFSDEDAAEQAARKMQDLGLIDDEAYAKRLASDLIKIKLFSKERAVYELISKGIDRELAVQTAEDIEVDSDEQIQKLLLKKFPHGTEDESAKRRAAAALARYGYKWEDIKKALSARDED